jgi:hypothetical protein
VGLLLVILLSVWVEPLVEIANVMREKIMLGSALTNACRAAKNRSLVYEKQRDLDAEVDPNLFRDYFSEAFEDALNLTRTTTAGDTITFTSNDGKYHPFEVTIQFQTESELGRETSKVSVEARSKYLFKTKYLKLASSAISSDYEMVSNRMLILAVRN